MPNKTPRINMVLKKLLHKKVQFLAKKNGDSFSTKLRDLVRDALDIQEDVHLARFVKKRQRSFKESSALTHWQVWS